MKTENKEFTEIDVWNYKHIEEKKLTHFHIGDKDEEAFKTIQPGNLKLNREDGPNIYLTGTMSFAYGDCGEDDHRVEVFYDEIKLEEN